MNITATLEDWQELGGVIWGLIYGDTRKRWSDGTYIRTSLISKITEDGIVITRNSNYKLGKPRVRTKSETGL